jgi:hypothetical protein
VAGAVVGVAAAVVTEEYQSSATLVVMSAGAGATNPAQFVLLRKQRLAERGQITAQGLAERGQITAQGLAERGPTLFNAGMTIPDYRRTRASIASPANFNAFAQRAGVTETIQRQVRTRLETEKGFAELIAPIYSQTRGEIRDVGETKLDRGEPVVSALRVTFSAETPESAIAGAKAVAEYVQDTLLRDAILNELIQKVAEDRSIKLSAESESLERRFAIRQIEATIQDLKRVVQQYPSSTRLDGRQVVSVQGGGDKYLSPIAQIVAAESRLSETRRELDQLARITRQADVALQFFGASQSLANDPMLSAAEISSKLIELVQARLQAPEAKDDAAQARLLALLTWLSTLRSVYLDQTRLLAAPSTPEKPQSLSRTQLGSSGALLGLFLALAVGATRRNFRRDPTGVSPAPN